MRKHRWARIGSTHMLFSLQEDHIVPEWQPVGQVTLRQVYEEHPPRWYVWLYTSDKAKLMDDSPFDTAAEAIEAVEGALDVSGRTERWN